MRTRCRNVAHSQLSKAGSQPVSRPGERRGGGQKLGSRYGEVNPRSGNTMCCHGSLSLSYPLVANWHQPAPIHASRQGKAGHGPRVRARHTATLSRVRITQEPISEV